MADPTPRHQTMTMQQSNRRELTPELRALRARAGALGAYVQQATHDTRETTRAAREAFNAKFLDQVDPHRELPEAERNRRAGTLRKAYFARLSLKAQAARRVKAKRQAATSGGPQG
ncbi:MAG: hypothetical protein JO352_18320 [Chloroflexi bacterium]|nr:hypothetical protein [Chloroflexota bacterium]